MVGLLVVALAFIPHSFPLFKAGGWSLIDFLVPVFAAWYVIKAIIQNRLDSDLRPLSILPFIFLLLTVLHVFTDPRLEEIFRSFTSYRLPVGGFRIYYSIVICITLYYLTPLVINNLEALYRFLRIYFFIVVAQIVICIGRIVFRIHTLPWDTYSSQVIQYEEISSYWGGGIRLILLGNMGLFLFTYAITLLKGTSKVKVALIIVAFLALVMSGGRATLFAALFIACLFIAAKFRKWFVAAMTGLFVVSVVAIFSLMPSLLDSFPTMPKRYLSILSPSNPSFQSDEYSRMEMWKGQFYNLKHHPLWGSVNDLPPHMDDRAKKAVIGGDTHNVYLGIASRFGIVTFTIWLLFISRQIRRSYSMIRNSPKSTKIHSLSLWLFLSLSAYLLLYLTGGGVGGGYADAYIIFSLIDIVHRLSYEEKSDVCAVE
ncbi:MAG: O-antigen ligase family protein [Candidatus Hodarchaeota archaeon]